MHIKPDYITPKEMLLPSVYAEYERLGYPANVKFLYERLTDVLKHIPDYEVWVPINYFPVAGKTIRTQPITASMILISNRGNICNKKTGKIRKLYHSQANNAWSVILTIQDDEYKNRTISVGRAVACAFIPTPEGRPYHELVAARVDIDNLSPGFENVYWTTRDVVGDKLIEEHRLVVPRGELNYNSKQILVDVVDIHGFNGEQFYFKSMSEGSEAGCIELLPMGKCNDVLKERGCVFTKVLKRHIPDVKHYDEMPDVFKERLRHYKTGYYPNIVVLSLLTGEHVRLTTLELAKEHLGRPNIYYNRLRETKYIMSRKRLITRMEYDETYEETLQRLVQQAKQRKYDITPQP